ncbi:MAG: PRC-barrel domain-containing protein [Thermodesulfobacteriota bacterium]
MRKITYALIGLFALSLLFVGSSFAASDESGRMAIHWDSFAASTFLGSALRTPLGEYIGHIDDFAINPSTGRIDSVLVSDITGVGSTVVAIPFDRISKDYQFSLVYNPREDTVRFYGSGYSELPYDAYRLGELPPMQEGDYRFTTLLGASVQSKEGEHVARINDLVINRDGHVVYAVLDDVGGMDKMVAAPFGALSKKGDRLFALDTTREKLASAPSFDWSDVTRLEFASDIYRHYGLQPYWETM